jgi:hypothetical protein
MMTVNGEGIRVRKGKAIADFSIEEKYVYCSSIERT